jgi:hypothetical protein
VGAVASNPATISDLEKRSLRPLSALEKDWASTRLDDAFDQLGEGVESRLDAVAEDSRYARLVVQVVCAMVLRVLNNPDGKLEEQGDDYRYRLDQAVSTGALYVSDAEMALLTSGSDASEGAFTIRPSGIAGSGYWSDSTTWVAL